ncbi:MAG: hypothetical protein WB762_01480 [Candidatus Sulfotelmatobacter sp.]
MKKDQRGLNRFQTKWRRMYGMPDVTERLVVSSPSVRGLLARLEQSQACIEMFYSRVGIATFRRVHGES